MIIQGVTLNGVRVLDGGVMPTNLILYLDANNSSSYSGSGTTSSNLYIGSYNNGEFAQWFDGKIGVTRLYNSALTSAQVLQNYNADRSTYGL